MPLTVGQFSWDLERVSTLICWRLLKNRLASSLYKTRSEWSLKNKKRQVRQERQQIQMEAGSYPRLEMKQEHLANALEVLTGRRRRHTGISSLMIQLKSTTIISRLSRKSHPPQDSQLEARPLKFLGLGSIRGSSTASFLIARLVIRL